MISKLLSAIKDLIQPPKDGKVLPFPPPPAPAPQNRPILDHAPELIKEFEQCRLNAYQDSAGVWTIGWGHTKGVKQGDVWTQERADGEFQLELENFEHELLNYLNSIGMMVNPHQFAALTSFAYNVGLGTEETPTRKRSGLRALVHNRTHSQVADAMLLYCKAGGKELRGLKIRRVCERELYLLPLEKSDTWNSKAMREKFSK